MSDREPATPPIQNPLYKGATPEDVGRALLRPVEPETAQKPDDEGEDAEAV